VNVPFFRPDIRPAEIEEVAATLRSGWLTTGPRVRQFEEEFARAVGATHALGLGSCTAALHLAVEALRLEQGQAVLVPTMTFAASAEVVRYLGAHPVLVDCEPGTLNVDLADAQEKLATLAQRHDAPTSTPVGIIPVHVGGLMLDMEAVGEFARGNGLWVVEDAAHAFPSAWRSSASEPWRRAGEATAAVTCFSFYANKTITTGEGGMAITGDEELAERMRLMALHGLSKDAWSRYEGGGSWDYQIVAPGFKYNMTDVAAAIGIHQLARAEEMRTERERIARRFLEELAEVEGLELPLDSADRIHSWHLFPIRLHLDRLTIDRNRFIDELRQAGVGTSVHWRPLHLHPYYRGLGWRPKDCPVATREWARLISLPIFPGMTEEEQLHVIGRVDDVCRRFRR
jgi:dTDP-4-amino-4,6-dideoxygalactose transaminase